MATRSNINVRVGDKYHVVYCHNNGYIENNGLMLFQHYNSQALAEKLVSGGFISILEQSCEKPEVEHTFQKPVDGFCVYYGRDRGDKEEDICMVVSDEIIDGQEYLYVWDGSQWLVSNRDYDNELLEKALKEMEVI